jgi:hypothetical protein
MSNYIGMTTVIAATRAIKFMASLILLKVLFHYAQILEINKSVINLMWF